MGRWRKNSKEWKIKQDLITKAHEQKRLDIYTMVEIYFNTSNWAQTQKAKDVLNVIIKSVKKRLKDENHYQVYGCLNTEGEYGLANMPEEYNFILNKKAMIVKGIVLEADRAIKSGRAKKMIANTEEISLVIEAPKKEDDN